jgi:hypothetical protein
MRSVRSDPADRCSEVKDDVSGVLTIKANHISLVPKIIFAAARDYDLITATIV